MMIRFTREARLAALVLLVACQLYGRLVSAKSPVRVLDGSDPLDIEAIARIMCESRSQRDGQISRLSTVDKLVEFFDQQVSGESHEFYKCKQLHGEALHQLQETLNASKENVCSDKKLALIEDFHNHFVSRLVEHKKSREEEQREAAPQLLRLFFMHYVMEVGAVCRHSLVRNIENLKKKLGDNIDDKLFKLKDQSSDSEGRAPLSAVFKSSMQKFTDLNPVEKCEDVLLFWDLFENFRVGEKPAKDEVTIEDELDPQTGEPIRMLVKLSFRSSRSLNSIKEHCHYNLKPIYSKLILPIIKLADLGYSNYGGQSRSELEQLKSSEALKLWYSATQMCEAILPVKYYEDPSLGFDEFVVITKREATELESAGAQSNIRSRKQLVYEPDTNSMEGLDRIESVAKVEPKKLVKSVKSNVDARRHVIGRIVIRLVRKYRSSFKESRVGRIFFPKPPHQSRLAKANQFGERDEVGQKLGESLESMSDADIEKLGGDAPSRMLLSRDTANGHSRMRLSDMLTVRKSAPGHGTRKRDIFLGLFGLAVLATFLFIVFG